jgi:hypothetical protein
MSKIEKKYRQAISAMSPAERVARGFALYSQFREMLRLKFSQENPDLSSREIEKLVAHRMYLTDRRTRDLLNRIP